jgi:hypothetical protein
VTYVESLNHSGIKGVVVIEEGLIILQRPIVEHSNLIPNTFIIPQSSLVEQLK